MKIGAVILAAGSSSRFGTVKQLLPLGDKPILQHVIDIAENAGLDEVVVVLGANYEEIIENITTKPTTKIIHNQDWQKGQSSSVRAGVVQMERDCDAILFLLGDQPFVTKELIRQEIRVFQESRADIVAPNYENRRGNPVLFGRVCFDDLKNLTGDGGGKALFGIHKVNEIEQRVFYENMDVDTSEDFEAAQTIYNAHSHLSTIILGAGLSSRMKQPKLLMRWGSRTVLGSVINAFQNAGVGDINVVTGAFRELVEGEAALYGAATYFNPDFENGEMLDSMKTGVRSLFETDKLAAFIALGDQPAVSSEDISRMAALFFNTQAPLIIPSYSMRRGHPWLISRELWNQILDLRFPSTMRDFIESNKERITYYIVKSSSILQDLDTPEDYEKYRPR